ncbi:hypothetical protein VP01_8483g1, partial [Puccinia sorghi]
QNLVPTPNIYNKRQSSLQRAAFSSQVGPMPSNYLVFIDKCAVSIRTHCRNQAWAPKGCRTCRLLQPLACRQISVLPAVSFKGLVCVIAQEGSMKCINFRSTSEFSILFISLDYVLVLTT